MARYFSADLIFPVLEQPIRNGWIETNDDGVITRLGEGMAPGEAEKFKGILIPGFVNAHCHLELSHLRGRISEKAGMTCFISNLVSQRFLSTKEEQLRAMKIAEEEMINNGIAAVGDISNFALSHKIKSAGNLYYHTFVEVLGLDPIIADEVMMNGRSLYSLFSGSSKNKASIVPHSAYSLSDRLFELLDKEYKNEFPVSIHMQESMDEYEFCAKKTGSFAQLFLNFHLNIHSFKETPDLTPIKRTLPKLKNCNKLMMVHNTFTKKEEIAWAEMEHENLYWCLCPNANLFISGHLPDFQLYNSGNRKVTIGTDSLASNHQLSILEELKVIQQTSPEIPFKNLIKWSTQNGAEFLGIESRYGSLTIGKNPGITLIEDVNTDTLILNKNSSSRRVV
jgi:aminodeoxyfutalosine deaminase